MYYRVKIFDGDVEELSKHLWANGYDVFKADDKNFFVYEEEIYYFQTIADEHGISYEIQY